MDKFLRQAQGRKCKRIIARDLKVSSPSLTREYPLVISKTKGMFIWDANNKKYLDFSALVAVMNVGHSNPEVIKAVKKQMALASHAGYCDFFAEMPVNFSETLLALLPNNFDRVFLSNSGTESVEAAFKLARWHTKKKWSLAFKPSFHGRTMGSLSLTHAKPVVKNRFDPFLPVKHAPYAYCYRCPFNDCYPGCGVRCLDGLEKNLKRLEDNVAAVFLEPIAGEPGYIVPPKEFVKGIKKLCRDYNALLVADEIQSGCYRSGSFLAIENFQVKPDIVCLSKSIGGGLPIGATAASKKIMNWLSGAHANTFGGNLAACAAGQACLTFMKKKKLGRNALKQGKLLKKLLGESQEKFELIGDVRGQGLMVGVELVKDRKTKAFALKERNQVLNECFKRGVILLPAGVSSIRFSPPLIVKTGQIEKVVQIFNTALKQVAK